MGTVRRAAFGASERNILRKIVVGSENDPARPEFPPDSPRFPATSSIKITVPGFSNVWFKDESTNPTGTHKDRMAWEIVVTYRDLLAARELGLVSEELPVMSIMSSGSAAIAIQTQLRRFNLPNLKVLADSSIDSSVACYLTRIGCEVYKVDLESKVLGWRDILELTNNHNGLDITSNSALDPSLRFYDWLSYEILNENPEFCFVPFGTGILFENILNVARREALGDGHDPRYSGNLEILRRCQFIGATTRDRSSRASKLYSAHLPFGHYNEQWMRLYRLSGSCGNKSGVRFIQEHFLDEAMMIAADQGLQAEPSALGGLAMLLQCSSEIPKDSKLLVISTGKTKFT